jgi:glycosyltransferase involved in cell wall biosynthesis
MRAAILFDNFGPYHYARLRASATVCDLTAVQVFARSLEYAWKPEIQAGDFRFETLFREDTSRNVQKQELGRKINQALGDCRPQVVFIPGWSSRAAFFALRWCLRHNIPAIAMSDSTARDEKRVGWKEHIKKRLVWLFSAGLVAGNLHRDYLSQLGMPQDRIFLGYDVVDNEYFRQKTEQVREQRIEIRTRQALPENYFLASARFMEKKNLPRLLQAYARYRTLCGKPEDHRPESFRSVPWSLVLLGDGSLRTELCALIAKLGLQESVKLPGFQQYSDLPFYYGLAGAFIHASTAEPWGLVVNEAMASRLPVLVSNRCGCACLVEEGRNGFIFDAYDIEGLAQLMQRVSNLTKEVLEAMGEESGRVIADWGPERFVDGFNQAARKALEIEAPQASWLDRRLLQGLSLR